MIGISEQWWQQLLNGVIGASISSAISIVVALLVVSKTNEHQAKLSEIALASQKESDRLMLEEQRASMLTQLEEQRRDATTERRLTVRAQVITAAQNAVHASHQHANLIEEARRELEMALTKWRLEAGEGALDMELINWTSFIYGLARDTFVKASNEHPDYEMSFLRMNTATSTLAVAAGGWPTQWTSDEVEGILRRTRENTMQELADANEPTSGPDGPSEDGSNG